MALLYNINILKTYQDEINKFLELDSRIDELHSVEGYCEWKSNSSGTKYVSDLVGEMGLYIKLTKVLHEAMLI